jgi:hypothetical protein
VWRKAELEPSDFLDPSYLDDAKTLSAFLRLADTPARVHQLRTSEHQSVAV